MKEKETIKYLDLVFNRIEKHNEFCINNILFEIIKPNNKNEKEVNRFFNIEKSITILARNKGLIIPIPGNGWFELTEKGKEFVNSKKNFINFTKQESKFKFEPYKLSTILVSIIFGLSTAYFAFVNYRLNLQESKVPSLELKVVSLTKELNHTNNMLIECRKKPLTKGLDTKKGSD